jgi:hypothetical protein
MQLIDNLSPGKKVTLLLAHGAGAPAQSEFMTQMKDFIGQYDIQIVRFNFPYMVEMISQNKRRPPNPVKQLIQSLNGLIDELPDMPLIIGGKSMGGRVATLCADHPKVLATLALGYPFHPPGKPDKLRTDHLITMTKPCLIIQGERDTFGTKHEVDQYPLSQSINVNWIPDGDHSFKPRKSSGLTLNENMMLAAKLSAEFINDQIA